jgi:Ser/Thr protein kinase RdoA (MazF antagonist)
MNTQDHKQAAAELGLEWSTVLASYREVRSLEAQELERIGTFRREAFQQLSGDDHGGRFKGRHRAAFAGGDATYIQGLTLPQPAAACRPTTSTTSWPPPPRECGRPRLRVHLESAPF